MRSWTWTAALLVGCGGDPAPQAIPSDASSISPSPDGAPRSDAAPDLIDAQPSTADARPPAPDAQPPTADAQPPAADAQPPAPDVDLGRPAPERGDLIAFTRGLNIPEVIDDITLTRGSAIWRVRADGSEAQAVLDESDESASLMPSFSPDKRQLVFASNRGAEGDDPSPPLDLWIIGVDGGEPRPLTRTPTIHEWTPAWSPRGDLIAYAATAAHPGSDHVWHLDVWVIQPDGANARLIYAGPGQDEDPVFSRDGQRLYFMVGNGESGCFFQIWQANVYGDPQAAPLRTADGAKVCGEDPSATPEGDRLLYARRGKLYAYNFATRQTQELASAEEPWAGAEPGQYVFTRDAQVWRGGGGEGQRAITEGPADYFPRWTP